MNTIQKTILSAALILTLGACAETKTDKKIDQKIQQEQPIQNADQVSNQAKQLIQNNPNFSADQKAQLMTLQKETRTKMDAFREESLKLRAILIQDVGAENYKASEVELIKKRMVKVENKRLDCLFKSIDQANKIIGRDIPMRTNVMNDMWDEHGRF